LIFKTLDFNTVFILTPFIVGLEFNFLGFTLSYLEIISLLLVIGAIGKSAQLGLHG
jgi:NADH-quinone oxidoreductase subunit L